MTEEIKTNFKEVEKKWQEFWEKHSEIYRAIDDDKRPKKYVLQEFPYPSGSGLHVGHAFSYTGADVYARFKRMQGFNTMFPMGWDAFGLPTENYAIKMKRKPQEITKENTEMFKKQMKNLACSFDWDREVDTTDPNYYKWTQWIFIQLFKKGLAYKKEMPINWCPSCKTGLANEEVVNGKCERCGAEASRRNISQWIVKITDYADKLIEGLKETNFIEKVKQSQINWIDRKEWIDITYKIENIDDTVTIATTRPDTNFGATFVVLAPEHNLVEKILNGEIKTSEDINKIKDYVIKAKNKSELERQQEVIGRDKTGVFTGLYAINPLTSRKMPIWITDFVLSSVGTGAVVGVPGHDIRDFEFAKQFGIDIIRVVVGKDGRTGEIKEKEDVQEEEGTMINSGFLDGMEIHEATKKIMDYLEEQGWGKRSIRYHLRDWIFSRQHYWGEPIPMVYCEKCGWQTVPEDQLPIVLPEVEHYEPTDDGQSPLSQMKDWVKTTCPKCGGEAKRETDTMPNWAGSDWYFLRYCDPHNDTVLASEEKLKYWMPVDVYIGGDEHNTLHLLYSRFIYKFLWDIGAVPKEIPEPYYKRLSHGVILGPDGQRMSKSKGNVIVPEEVADKYGVDVVRMYLMFMGPFDGTMAWNEKTLMGVKRFLDRFEKFVRYQISDIRYSNESASNTEVKVIINKLIDAVTKDLEDFKFNTAIAKMMEALNNVSEVGCQMSDVKTLIKLMAPFAPYMAEELWSVIGDDTYVSVHISGWPKVEEKYLIEEKITLAISVNGKVRGEMEIDVALKENKDEVLKLAKEVQKIKPWIEGKTILKEVYVPGRILNLVVS